MSVTASDLKTLIESELAAVSDPRVIQQIRKLLVEPYVELRNWDYGEPGQQYPCWIVFRDMQSRTEIAYCEYGFGPRCPWGLVSSADEEQHRSMGMDSGWFTTFLDAFFESTACVELPIWRVIKVEADGTRTHLTDENAWDATWRRIYKLRLDDPTGRCECGYAITYG